MKPEAGSAWNVGMGKIMPYPRRKTGAILRQNRLSGEKPESAARNGIVRGSHKRRKGFIPGSTDTEFVAPTLPFSGISFTVSPEMKTAYKDIPKGIRLARIRMKAVLLVNTSNPHKLLHRLFNIRVTGTIGLGFALPCQVLPSLCPAVRAS